MKSALILSFLLPLFIFSCKEKEKPEAEKPATGINQLALIDLNEQPLDMSKYKGKTVFVNFWATWCKPCLMEMPSIQKAKEQLKNEEVVFLFASDETKEQIEEFRDANQYDFNFVRINNMEELNIQALPTTVIFDTNGNIKFSEAGYKKWDDEKNINLILK